MDKLILKRIKLNFDEKGSDTIDFKKLKEKLKSEIESEHVGHKVFYQDDLTTITDDYLILAFSINENKIARSL
jgi:hypothetical protein